MRNATLERFHQGNLTQLRQQLANVIEAYNFGSKLKAPKGLLPYKYIRKPWLSEPNRFKLQPTYLMLG